MLQSILCSKIEKGDIVIESKGNNIMRHFSRKKRPAIIEL
jgi:hypothetical protein